MPTYTIEKAKSGRSTCKGESHNLTRTTLTRSCNILTLNLPFLTPLSSLFSLVLRFGCPEREGCKSKIEDGSWRFGSISDDTGAGFSQTYWKHVCCVSSKVWSSK